MTAKPPVGGGTSFPLVRPRGMESSRGAAGRTSAVLSHAVTVAVAVARPARPSRLRALAALPVSPKPVRGLGWGPGQRRHQLGDAGCGVPGLGLWGLEEEREPQSPQGCWGAAVERLLPPQAALRGSTRCRPAAE